MKHQPVLLLTMMMTVIMLAVIPSSAQDQIREVGLTFRNFDGFGLDYKTGSSLSLWRFNSLFLSASEREDETYWNDADLKSSSYAIEFRVGREFRKAVVEDFQFRYGLDISFGFSKVKSRLVYDDATHNTSQETQTFTPGINALVGVNYVLKEKIVIGVEVLPGITYTTGSKTSKDSGNPEATKSDISGFNFGLSSSAALLTLAYRFSK